MSNRKRIDAWATTREMMAPELARVRARWPSSKRRAALEALAEAAAAEDTEALDRAGLAYLTLTRAVPPGCYAHSPDRPPHFFLAGERVVGSRRGEAWAVRPYSVQMWR